MRDTIFKKRVFRERVFLECLFERGVYLRKEVC